MEYVNLGTIIDSFGLDGTLKIISTTDFGSKRYKKGNTIYLFNPDDNSRIELTVENYRNNGQIDFVKVNEINSKEDALAKKRCLIQVIKDINDLPKDHYFFSDLEGCEVIDQNNIVVGKVKKVEEFPAQITLRVIGNSKKDFFVPFIKDFIIKVDIENKQIFINVIEGML